MKENEVKKYHCAVWMVTDGLIDDYRDIDLIIPNYNLKCVCKIITTLVKRTSKKEIA